MKKKWNWHKPLPCLKSASRGCFQSFAGLREREIVVPDEKRVSSQKTYLLITFSQVNNCHLTQININKQPTKVTCTTMPISDKSGFAYAHVWSVCVITRSLLVTFANECLTFICRKIRKKEGPKKNTWININYRYKHFDFYQTAIGTQQLSNSRKPQFILVVLWP